MVGATTDASAVTPQGAREAKEAMEWFHAEKLAEALEQGHTPRQLAVENYLSASKVRQYAKTAQVFAPDERCDLPFEVHVVCAQTSQPQYWLDWAVTHQASKREVQAAIKDATAGQPVTRETWQRRGEAVEQQFRRWAEDAPPDLVVDVADRIDRLAQSARKKVGMVASWIR